MTEKKSTTASWKSFQFLRTRSARRKAAAAALILIFSIAFVAAVAGIDFGVQWDEKPHMLVPLYRSVMGRTLLSREYLYPSFCHDLELAVLLPDLIHIRMTNSGGKSERELLANVIPQSRFLFRLRFIFIVLSLLAVIWVYLAVYKWRKSAREALFAAAICAFSWEFSYHARWVSPNTLLLQFAAAVMACLVYACESPRPWAWIRGAAILAGLTAGTKYNGAPILLPLGIVAFYLQRKHRTVPLLRIGFEIAVFFTVSYLLTTPATIFDHQKFMHDVRYQMQYYASGHYGHTVQPGSEHLLLMIAYIATALFSSYMTVSLCFFAFALAGAWALWREKDPRSLAFLSLPFVYLVLFSEESVMIVRNLVVLLPFVAVMAARGIVVLSRGKRQALLINAVAVTLLAVNAWWIVDAGFGIRNKKNADYAAEAAQYVLSHPSIKTILSVRASKEILPKFGTKAPNIVADPYQADAVLFYSSEVMLSNYLNNRPRYVIRCFGPREVNFNYYPNWQGDERIVLMYAANAEPLGIHFGPQAQPSKAAVTGI